VPSFQATIERLKTELAHAASPESRAELELELGEILTRTGNPEEALAYLGSAREFYARKSNTRRSAIIDELIGVCCALKGENERALAYFRQGLAAAGDPLVEARLRCSMGLFQVSLGAWEEASASLRRAHEILEPGGPSAELARTLRGLSALARIRGDLGRASTMSEEAVRIAEIAGDGLELGRALLERALLHQAEGDPRLARRSFRRAITTLAEHGFGRDLGEAYYLYGLFLGQFESEFPEGLQDPPAFWLAKAQALFKEHGTLADLERVRDGFRRFGRRATDRISDERTRELVEHLRANRMRVAETEQLYAHSVERLCETLRHGGAGTDAGPLAEMSAEVASRRNNFHAALDSLAAAEERFLSAFNAVLAERENIRTLLELSRALNQIRDPATVAEEAVKMVATLTRADRVVFISRREDGSLHMSASLRAPESSAHEWRAIVERALATGPVLLQEEPSRDDRAEEQATEQFSLELGRAIATPLRLGDTVFGAVYADKELCGGVFTKHDLDLLVIFCSQLATVLQNLRVTEELRAEAKTREVTMHAISNAVLSLDGSGRFTSVNAAAARALGVDPKSATTLSLAHFPDLAIIRQVLVQGEEIDERVVRLGSNEFLLHAQPVRSDDGTVIGAVAILTEMRKAQSLAQRIVGSTARFSFGDIIGTSNTLRRQIHLAEAAARSDSSVLITGESGTGKELFAQSIHNASARAQGPFVAINCAAIPRELLESELFGYEAGAFTGAKRSGHPGKFELAEGGTILLDEIGDMPLEMQAKLLRVLQERRVQRIGGTREIRLDARVIATTNRDLTNDVARGRFRQDLFFRLKVIHIHLPPLRERPEDIPLLVAHFLRVFSTRLGKQIVSVSPEVMQALMEHSWPGNVRELENVLESTINLAPPDATVFDRLPESFQRSQRLQQGTTQSLTSIEDAERELLRAALVAHRGCIPHVARALGVSRGTVYNKMRRFGFDPEDFRHGKRFP